MTANERNRERIVVIGGGLAGLRAAERVRELGYVGELVMVTDERYRPYHRPALTKQMLSGELRPNDLALHSYTELDAVWRFGQPALRLDPKRHVVEMPGDEELRYDGLVIASGVESRHLAGAPRHDPRVHVLRTLRDAISVQKNLRHTQGRVVVIGGGFTACEIASTARDMGRDVTLVSRGKVLCDRVFGKELGGRITELHHQHGVQLALGATVTHWMCQSWGIGLYLSTGQLVVADCVILAVGGVPAVSWLRGSGLTIEDGVLCRPTCHVQGANDIVAAGDVARWPNLRFEAVPRRLEHWINAVEMGRHAAESLMAGPSAAKPFTPLPRFWTEQHGVRIQASGMPSIGQEAVRLSGKPGKRGVIGRLRGGRLIGIVGWDSPRGMIRWTAELERELRRPWTSSMPAIPADAPLDEPAAVEIVQNAHRSRPDLSPIVTSLPGMEALESPETRDAIAAMELQMADLDPAEFTQPNQQTRPAIQSRPDMVPVAPPGAQSMPGMQPAMRSRQDLPPAARSVPGMSPVARAAAQSRAGMTPVPPPSQQGMHPVPPPGMGSRQGMNPVPPPSQQGMHPVPPPGARSQQGMSPVPPPGMGSRQNMPPVPPPGMGSRQGMNPVPPPSQQGMHPVPPPGARSQQGMTPVPPPALRSRQDMPPVPPPGMGSQQGMNPVRPPLPKRSRQDVDGPPLGMRSAPDLPPVPPPAGRSRPDMSPVIGPRADMPPPLRTRSGMTPVPPPSRPNSRTHLPPVPPPATAPPGQGSSYREPYSVPSPQWSAPPDDATEATHLPPALRALPDLPPLPDLPSLSALEEFSAPPEAFRTMPKWPIGRG